MPSTNTTDEHPAPDFSKLDTEPPSSNLRTSSKTNNPTNAQQPESRPTATATAGRPPRRDSQDVRPPRRDLQDVRPLRRDSQDVKLQTRDINPQNQDVKPQNQDVKPHNQDVKSQNQDVKSQNQDAKSQNQLQNRDVKPQDQDVKPHNNERESKKSQDDRDLPDTPGTATIIANPFSITNTTSTKRPPSIDRHDKGSRHSGRQEGSDPDSDSSYVDIPDQSRRSTIRQGATSSTGLKPSRVPLNSQLQAPYAQATRSTANDPQQPLGAAQGNAPRGVIPSQPSTERSQNVQAIPGHLPEEEQQEMSENRQPAHGPGLVGTLMSYIPAGNPAAPKDKYQALKEDFRQSQYELKQAYGRVEEYKRELLRTRQELRGADLYINDFRQEKQRWKDHMAGLQNELTIVHQQLEDAKHLSEVRGKELVGAQVFLTKADTLSISEVGEKVTALNEDIFQAAATLGEALVYKPNEVPREEFDAAVVQCRKIIGATITDVLITQAQKPEPEVNPLLVQVVLQIFMVKFCVSKIRSWYPGDSTIEGFLNAIYSEIRATEDPAVSGRWRALTRAHTRPSGETWTAELTERLVLVLKVAAWAAGSHENQESFLHRLPPIFKAVSELRIAIGEKFTSADLDISTFECGDTYEPLYMEDAYEDARQPSGKRAPEVIVGTTGIGLMKLMAQHRSKDALQFHSVISAKIVLQSTLKEALEPVQSSGRLRKKKRVVESADDAADQDGRGNSKPKTG